MKRTYDGIAVDEHDAALPEGAHGWSEVRLFGVGAYSTRYDAADLPRVREDRTIILELARMLRTKAQARAVLAAMGAPEMAYGPMATLTDMRGRFELLATEAWWPHREVLVERSAA